MEATRRHDAIALAILAGIITLFFADVLIGTNVLFARDISHYYYPAKSVLREIVLSGSFPSWNPYFAAGQPLAANPEHEVFYPLTWLILLPSYSLGFHLLMVLHLHLTGFTTYALLRSMRIRATAAFFGALSMGLGGICLSYLTLLPILFSVAWLPLTCLYTRRFLLQRSWRDFALASLFFAIQLVIGEPTTVLQTGILLGMFAIASSWRRGGRAAEIAPQQTGVPGGWPTSAAGRSGRGGMREAARAVGLVGLISVAALLTAAVQILPALDHASDSVRARGFPLREVTEWSMPPARMGEFLYPNLLGHVGHEEGRRHYWAASLYRGRGTPFLPTIYPGLLLAVLAIAGMLAGVRGARLFVAVIVVSALLAFGDFTPLWRILHDLGPARSMRYPEKFILMAFFAVIVFGTRALDELLGGNARVRRAASGVAAVVTVVALLAALFSRSGTYASLFARWWSLEPEHIARMLAVSTAGWLLASARGGAVLLLIRNGSTGSRKPWIALSGLFVLLDLGLIISQVVPRLPASYYDAPAVARLLPAERTEWRLFHQASWHRERAEVSPYFAAHPDLPWVHRNAMLMTMPVQHGIRMALDADYDLTALIPTADFIEAAAELSKLRSDWVDVAASMSNVWYRAVFRPPQETFAAAGGDRRLVQPVGILALERSPRYYFADHVEPIAGRADFVRKLASRRFDKGTAFVPRDGFTPAAGVVKGVEETANTARMEVETLGRAFLVISVTPHKHWRITIDGQETEAIVTNVGYQGVIIPGGRHVIEMRYRNPLIAIGGAISLAALLALAWVAVRMRAL